MAGCLKVEAVRTITGSILNANVFLSFFFIIIIGAIKSNILRFSLLELKTENCFVVH